MRRGLTRCTSPELHFGVCFFLCFLPFSFLPFFVRLHIVWLAMLTRRYDVHFVEGLVVSFFFFCLAVHIAYFNEWMMLIGLKCWILILNDGERIIIRSRIAIGLLNSKQTQLFLKAKHAWERTFVWPQIDHDYCPSLLRSLVHNLNWNLVVQEIIMVFFF